MRTPNSLAPFAIAALILGGCARTVRFTAQPVDIKFLASGKCAVDPKDAVIDYKTDHGKGLEVEWSRGTSTNDVQFLLKNSKDERILPGVKGSFGASQKKNSGKARGLFGKWKKDSHGHKEYRVGYDVLYGGVACDPQICIRKSGTGCDT